MDIITDTTMEFGLPLAQYVSNITLDKVPQRDIDVAKLAKDGAPYISFVEQLPYRNNTILRMVTRPDINPSTRRDGLN